MALNDNAVLNVGTARFYTADEGTEFPANPLAPGADWTDVGHTSTEDIFSITTEGGEETTLGSLQNPALRRRRGARTLSFGFSIHQFDVPGLKLYFGSNARETSDGRIAPAQTPAPTIAAFLVVIEDGDYVMAFYAPKADILGSEDLSLADQESLSALPISVTPLGSDGAEPYEILPVTPKSEFASGS